MSGNQTTAARPEAAPKGPPTVETEADAPSRRRVLIVEDNDTARKQIQVFLETDPNLAVDTAANGSDALKALDQRPYSVIVTDLKMPKIDGLQLLEEVQKRRAPGRHDHHHRLRHGRAGGAGDADGGSGLPHQADQPGAPQAGDPARACASVPCRTR